MKNLDRKITKQKHIVQEYFQNLHVYYRAAMYSVPTVLSNII